jgi:hypothetical protein
VASIGVDTKGVNDLVWVNVACKRHGWELRLLIGDEMRASSVMKGVRMKRARGVLQAWMSSSQT